MHMSMGWNSKNMFTFKVRINGEASNHTFIYSPLITMTRYVNFEKDSSKFWIMVTVAIFSVLHTYSFNVLTCAQNDIVLYYFDEAHKDFSVEYSHFLLFNVNSSFYQNF